MRDLGETLYGLEPSGKEFSTWSAQVVKEAQDMVALPHVQRAIFKTTERLMTKSHLSFQEVAQILFEAGQADS